MSIVPCPTCGILCTTALVLGVLQYTPVVGESDNSADVLVVRNLTDACSELVVGWNIRLQSKQVQDSFARRYRFVTTAIADGRDWLEANE